MRQWNVSSGAQGRPAAPAATAALCG